jgi:hypothetical protein
MAPLPGSSADLGCDYSRFEFPNWAGKFFADALLMDMTDARVPSARRAKE